MPPSFCVTGNDVAVVVVVAVTTAVFRVVEGVVVVISGDVVKDEVVGLNLCSKLVPDVGAL